jgi:hypothetical protein
LNGIEALLVEAAALAGLVLVVAFIFLTAAATIIVRRVRRRWHLERRPGRSRLSGYGLAHMVSVSGRHAVASMGLNAVDTVASPRWWATQQARRRMWRAMAAARHAVTVARRASAPIGDLPALLRQLEVAARSADALARAGAHGPGRAQPVIAEVGRIEDAATRLQDAAVQSLQALATADVDPLLPAVRREVAALAAGARAAALLGLPPA